MKNELKALKKNRNQMFVERKNKMTEQNQEPTKETKQDCTKCIHYAECYLRRHNEAIDYCQDFDKNPWEN